MSRYVNLRSDAGFLAAAAMIAVAWTFHAQAQERTGGDGAGVKRGAAKHDHHGKATDSCATACAECQQICESCVAHCANQIIDGKKGHDETLRTCMDCAEICSASARIVARGGPFSATICRACAEACARCAEACEKFPDDTHMSECAKTCRKCQHACETMIGQDRAVPPAQDKSKTP